MSEQSLSNLQKTNAGNKRACLSSLLYANVTLAKMYSLLLRLHLAQEDIFLLSRARRAIHVPRTDRPVFHTRLKHIGFLLPLLHLLFFYCFCKQKPVSNVSQHISQSAVLKALETMLPLYRALARLLRVFISSWTKTLFLKKKSKNVIELFTRQFLCPPRAISCLWCRRYHRHRRRGFTGLESRFEFFHAACAASSEAVGTQALDRGVRTQRAGLAPIRL